MTKQTNVLLKVIQCGREDKEIQPYCRVKIDGHGFPYIVVNWQKFIISEATFPQILSLYGDEWGKIIECIEGIGELQSILTNPELTTDKLSVKQLARVSHG